MPVLPRVPVLPRAASPVLVSVAAVALLTAGCTGASEPSAPEPSPEPTPLASYDTSEVVVQRAPFCGRVAVAAVERAVGEAGAPEAWTDGDRIALPGGSSAEGRDVVQEHGCRWSGPDGQAAAWVAAPPVTRRLARSLAGSQPEGCEPLPDAPRYGRPSVALRCGGEEIRYAGLFGDAWLTCVLGGPDASPESAGEWCVAVAEAAAPAG